MKYQGLDVFVEVTHIAKKGSKELPTVYVGESFKTYRAVAKILKEGELAFVRVRRFKPLLGLGIVGYGSVEKTEDGWIEPRILAREP